MSYLFVHFKEKITLDGEAVYFGISKDGFNWEQVNGGEPVLISTLGDKGCRDIEIVRLHTGGFVIITTDLCIATKFDENYNVDWKHINSHGSKCLCMWKTNDLVNFSEQRLVYFGRDDFGCMWAPEVFFDEATQEYLVHWGSTVAEDNYTHMSIYCSVTKDFEEFSQPKLFFTKKNEILDSHITKVGDTYHLFYKNSSNPPMNMHAISKNLYGPYEHDSAFERYMAEEVHHPGSYEGATTFTLPDGRWCFMADFFGCEKEKMGYVPFISSKPGDMSFTRCPDAFSFPYGFKHGKCIEITDEEYETVKNARYK
jgi:hypothetical protein